MPRKSLLSAVLLATLGACGPAAADGPGAYGYTPTMLMYDWSGIYVGGQVGAANNRARFTISAPAENFDQNQFGFSGGGFVGYQRQFSQIVLGAEVGYAWLGVDTGMTSLVDPGATLTARVDGLFTLTGKFGWAYNNYLAYFRGGAVLGDVTFSSAGGANPNSSTVRETGWLAGMGLDWAVTPNISLGVTYDYIKLPLGNRDQTVTTTPVQVIGEGIDIQVAMARLTFKFGGPRVDHDAVAVK